MTAPAMTAAATVLDLHAIRLARGLDAPRPFAVGDRVAVPDLPPALVGVTRPDGRRDIVWGPQWGFVLAFVTPDADGTHRVRVALGYGAVVRRVDQVRPIGADEAANPAAATFVRGLPVRVIGREAEGTARVVDLDREGGRIVRVHVAFADGRRRVYSPWRLAAIGTADATGPGGTAA
jgi:hypothetical protein